MKTAGGAPETNVMVTFAASDSGGLDAASVPTDSTGTAKVRWRLAAVTRAQTLVATVGSRTVTFTGTATTNPWTVGINNTVPYATRPADEGSQSGSGEEARVPQFWHPVFPTYDQLIAPGTTDNVSSMAFLKQLVAAKQFNIAFRSTTANTLLAPTFGTAGLSQVLPQVLTMCPGWP